jgi:tetratricopeptide (TPR) repeat protein
MNTLIRRLLTIALLASGCQLAAATSPGEAIRPIQTQWAEIKYKLPEKQQAERYHALALEARKLVETNPDMAEALIWEGIVLSSEAGAKGGLGALSLAKEARDRLEAARSLNEAALNGSAYTSLATLYAKVPRWPIGFGDMERAESYFKKSLGINPDGIDPNYFYGEFLVDNNRVAEARPFLEKALKAAPRPGRELADRGRRQEVQALLNKLNQEAR